MFLISRFSSFLRVFEQGGKVKVKLSWCIDVSGLWNVFVWRVGRVIRQITWFIPGPGGMCCKLSMAAGVLFGCGVVH